MLVLIFSLPEGVVIPSALLYLYIKWWMPSVKSRCEFTQIVIYSMIGQLD